MAYAITLAYSFRHHFPFSTYGENLFLTVQNIFITHLIIYFAPTTFLTHRTGTFQKIVIASVFMAATGVALGTISLDTLALLQITTLPLSVFSKLPQIRQNFRSKSTGQLSAFAVVSQIAGCLARLFTTATEIGDSLVSAGFAVALLLNLILGAQLWLYWGENDDSKDPYQDPPRPSHAPKMSSLSLCCVIEDEDIVFPVDVPAQARVSALKKEIQRERAMGTLQGVDPHILELWKVCVSNE
jgi:mannose-P-dolichol utilization defect protein 1